MAYVAVIGERRTSDTKVRRRHAIKLRMGIGLITLTASTVALASVLSILYFMQINRLTLAGYSINDLEEQIQEYREKNKKLSYEVAQRKALTIVERDAEERLQMVPAQEVQYFWQEEHENLLAKQ